MPLTAQQNIEQGTAWRNYATELQGYQTVRGSDPSFDNVTAMHWIIDALQISKQYYLQAINAAYDDADAAFSKLQDVTQTAAGYVADLKAQAASWNRFAKVATAMESLVTALEPPFNPISILKAADGVANAYSDK